MKAVPTQPGSPIRVGVELTVYRDPEPACLRYIEARLIYARYGDLPVWLATRLHRSNLGEMACEIGLRGEVGSGTHHICQIRVLVA